MIRSIQRQLWLMALMVAGGVTFVLAAEPATDPDMRMSFDRECKRLATDVLGAAPTADRGQARTIAPRASPDFPLQQPPHPPEAREHGGTVVMEIFVTEAGLVSEARVFHSSGDVALDRAAMKATQHWRLLPGTVDGEPVCMWGKFAVMFQIDEI